MTDKDNRKAEEVNKNMMNNIKYLFEFLNDINTNRLKTPADQFIFYHILRHVADDALGNYENSYKEMNSNNVFTNDDLSNVAFDIINYYTDKIDMAKITISKKVNENGGKR